MGLLVFLSGMGCTAEDQPAQLQAEEYPQPRYPHYLLNPSAEKLLDAARVAVRQPYGRSPLGKMESGQTAHVFLQYGQDMLVWEAVKQAWAERGVEAVAMGSWELVGMTKEEYEEHVKENLLYGHEAWQELGVFLPQYKLFFPEKERNEFGQPLTSSVLRKDLPGFLDRHPEIQYFFAGTGGGVFWRRGAGEEHADKFMGNWIYWNPIDLVSKAAQFPADVWNLVDDRITDPIRFVSEGTFSDPEGTRLSWTVTPEEAQIWAENAGISNHLYIYPRPSQATLKEGIVRAGSNHTGFYPTMTVWE